MKLRAVVTDNATGEPVQSVDVEGASEQTLAEDSWHWNVLYGVPRGQTMRMYRDDGTPVPPQAPTLRPVVIHRAGHPVS